MDGGAGCVLLRRLQPAAFLPVEQGDRADPVGREASQIHLHVLGIVDLDPIQEDAHMLTTQAPDIDRLEATHAPVVLDLYACKMPQRVGHLRGSGRLRRQVHFLHRPHDGPRLDGKYGRRRKGIRLLRQKAQRGG